VAKHGVASIRAPERCGYGVRLDRLTPPDDPAGQVVEVLLALP
jgi:hypothetical protein